MPFWKNVLYFVQDLPAAQQSDALRLALLAKYGGVWPPDYVWCNDRIGKVEQSVPRKRKSYHLVCGTVRHSQFPSDHPILYFQYVSDFKH